MKTLILFFLLLIPFISKSQESTQGVSGEEVYSDWKLSNQGGFGISSFYWRITRIEESEGVYKYSIWFYSNNVYPNGLQASTYVSGLSVYVNGSMIKTNIWVLFKTQYTNPLLDFESGPDPVVVITWLSNKIY